MNSIETLEAHVREHVRRLGLDPHRDRHELSELVNQTITEYDHQVLLGRMPPLGSSSHAAQILIDAVGGLGKLQPYMDDPTIEEIWINSPTQVFVAKAGVSALTNTVFTADEVQRLVENMLTPTGRRLDLSNPFVDAMLPGGERLHVVIPDVTRKHMSVNIRKFVARADSLEDLVARGSLHQRAARFLEASAQAGLNIVVSGATGAGKTTFLRALAHSIPRTERLVTIEEVFELNLKNRDVVALQCRQANLEGQGEISMRRLVKESLRMRPDRIVVGEVREAEALDLLIALNAGLPGLATLHANSARDAVLKLTTLPLLAGENVTAQFVTPTVASAVDLVVQLDRDSQGKRVVREICGLTGRVEEGKVEISTIFARQGNVLRRMDGYPPKTAEFERIGANLVALLDGASQWAS